MHLVNSYNVFKGMHVRDSGGHRGIVRKCDNPHNIHVTFEGIGTIINWYKKSIECGKSSFYCFVEKCNDNTENMEPLYYDSLSKQEAIRLMKRGKKITHRLFGSDEWITMRGNMILLEDGVKCHASDFWELRNKPVWNNGYYVFEEK